LGIYAYESLYGMSTYVPCPSSRGGCTVRNCVTPTWYAAVVRRGELIRPRYQQQTNRPAGPCHANVLPWPHGTDWRAASGHRRQIIARTSDHHDASHPITLSYQYANQPPDGDREGGSAVLVDDADKRWTGDWVCVGDRGGNYRRQIPR
jgi:hypothetical protein